MRTDGLPKFAANLTMMFTEYEPLKRFERAAKAGFKFVEYLFPYSFEATRLKEHLDNLGLEQVLFNCPPGDWEAGDRGIAIFPQRKDEFRKSLDTALEYAEVLKVDRLHVMAGIPGEWEDPIRLREVYIENVRYAAKQARSAGKQILLEPLNTVDVPGYFINFQDQTVEIIKEIGESNARLQFDFYHCQIMQGDLANNFEKLFDYVGHVQIAGVPGRHEPDVGEINYPYLFDLMDRLGYEGFVGCEYIPKDTTEAGLGWIKGYLGSGFHLPFKI
jgi:hydroxypyruvate isomerase